MEKKMENKMETREYIGIIRVYSARQVDRIWLWVFFILRSPYTPYSIYLRGAVLSTNPKPEAANHKPDNVSEADGSLQGAAGQQPGLGCRVQDHDGFGFRVQSSKFSYPYPKVVVVV